jgi:hypothetical protein
MADETIRKKWEEFINDDKYKEYFLSNEDTWNNNLQQVKEFIDKKKYRPKEKSKNKDEKYLGQ